MPACRASPAASSASTSSSSFPDSSSPACWSTSCARPARSRCRASMRAACAACCPPWRSCSQRRCCSARCCCLPWPASSRTSRSRRSLRRSRRPTSSSGCGSNYFSEQADLMPLLHTWSLSVEEQYYLVWPTLLIALMLVARKRWGVFTRLLLTALLLVGITTFAAERAHDDSDPPGAFFLMPMRAWEFALGGALVLAAPIDRALAHVRSRFAVRRRHRADRCRDRDARQQCRVSRNGRAVADARNRRAHRRGLRAGFAPVQGWLSSRGMVAIGQLSYSWYLWHWPLLALARANDLGERDLTRDGTIALLSLGLAWLTYHFVEHPIRTRQYPGFRATRTTLLSGAAMSAVVVCCALTLGFVAQYSQRTSDGPAAEAHCRGRPRPTAVHCRVPGEATRQVRHARARPALHHAAFATRRPRALGRLACEPLVSAHARRIARARHERRGIHARRLPAAARRDAVRRRQDRSRVRALQPGRGGGDRAARTHRASKAW